MKATVGMIVIIASVILGGCAPTTILSNERQVVIEAVNLEEAAGVAEAECARRAAVPVLMRYDPWVYVFSCAAKDRTGSSHAQAAPAPVAPSPAAPSPAASVPTVDPTVPSPPPPPPSVAAWVQVAADPDGAAARETASTLKTAYPELLATSAPAFTETVAANGRRFTRARFGFETRAEAQNVCRALRAENHACFVAAETAGTP